MIHITGDNKVLHQERKEGNRLKTDSTHFIEFLSFFWIMIVYVHSSTGKIPHTMAFCEIIAVKKSFIHQEGSIQWPITP